jgi:hypothetical protein
MKPTPHLMAGADFEKRRMVPAANFHFPIAPVIEGTPRRQI